MMNNASASSPRNGKRALIIGSGIAGLLAARVLSDYYDEVQIIERDVLPEEPKPRPGATQSFHLHRLAARGKEAMQSLFPGLTEELLERGAVSTPSKTTQLVTPFGQFAAKFPDELAMCSRALLEFTIRQRVQALPNTFFAPGLDVIGLQMDPTHTCITGLHDQAQQPAMLTADLIVDASGHFSKITQWLQELDYEIPEPERLKTALGYSTRYYQGSPQFNQQMAGITIFGHPEKQIRSAYGLQVEGGQWYVILFGAGGHYPATEDADFDRQLFQVTSPALANALRDEAEAISSPRGYRIPECRRNHFEQIANWPTGLLVMGDAFCNLDPIYGHGMTVAALEAGILAHSLREQRENPQPDFERRVLTSFQEAIEPAWWIDAITDLRWSAVTYAGQEPPREVAFFQRYLDLYQQEAMKRMQEAIKFAMERVASGSHEPAPEPNIFSPEPSMVSYFFVFDLLISPLVVFNATTYRLLLEVEASQEEPHLLHDMTDAYRRPLDEIINELLPTFALPFKTPKK